MWKIFGIAETQMPGMQSPVHSLVHSDRYSAARDWWRRPGAGGQITLSQLSLPKMRPMTWAVSQSTARATERPTPRSRIAPSCPRDALPASATELSDLDDATHVRSDNRGKQLREV